VGPKRRCIAASCGILPALVSGAVITEGIFNWPGMGRLYLDAAFTRDYPLLLAIITFTTVVTLLATLSRRDHLRHRRSAHYPLKSTASGVRRYTAAAL
jgi:ABC-type antimicrobial peptide transport system permease subunit